MSLKITQGDITKMQVDAIVNAANEQLLAGGGVCGAIFHAAGYAKLTSACQEIGFCPTGQAIATKGYQLSAPYIIHTVGPSIKMEKTERRHCFILHINHP